ncbi:MAG TPA: hypothetical protein VIY90_13445 [Steroidobacteraceae bacterium]
MSFPEPHPGLVIRYSYPWKREHEEEDREGEREVLILAITHIEPDDPADGIEIPPQTKNRLGLDHDRSWTDFIAYGPLPPKFFAHVRDCFLRRDAGEKATRVQRTE